MARPWQQHNRDRENAVMAMVHQELERGGRDTQEGPAIAKALLQDPAGEKAQEFRQYAEAIPEPLHGWTDQEIKNLGRNPEPRELSPAGRQRDMHIRNRELLGALMAPGLGAGNTFTAADDWRSKSGRTHGTSGWMGALANPEYTAGWVVNPMNIMADAAHFQFSGQDPPSKAEAAAERGAMARLGGIFRRYVTKHIPAAMDWNDWRQNANKVEPIIPKGMDREQWAKLQKDMKHAEGPTFDEWYRLKYGQYPSYALSTAAVFGNGMIDPSYAITGPAAKAATMLGAGLMKAGAHGLASGGLKNAALRTAYNYGKSVAKDAAPMARQGAVRAGLSEATEEFPTNVGLMAAFANMLPKSVTEAFAGGNKYRRDLYKPRRDQQGDWILNDRGQVALFEETPEEFEANIQPKLNAAQTRKMIPGLMFNIQDSLLQP